MGNTIESRCFFGSHGWSERNRKTRISNEGYHNTEGGVFVIRVARPEDASLVHRVMLSAFEEYRHIDVPSSALDETVDSIEAALRSGSEHALLFYRDSENSIYEEKIVALCGGSIVQDPCTLTGRP